MARSQRLPAATTFVTATKVIPAIAVPPVAAAAATVTTAATVAATATTVAAAAAIPTAATTSTTTRAFFSGPRLIYFEVTAVHFTPIQCFYGGVCFRCWHFYKAKSPKTTRFPVRDHGY